MYRVANLAGGSVDPSNNTPLIYHSDRHNGALFGFDEADYKIKHTGGKIWHPSKGSPNPEILFIILCILCSNCHAVARFNFGDINEYPMSPYPSPNLSGDWKLVRDFVTP